jgi:hypothetical protein
MISTQRVPDVPFVLVCYSHHSKLRRERVAGLVKAMREKHVKVVVDEDHALHAPPKGWRKWMDEVVPLAKAVLVVWSHDYLAAWQDRSPLGKSRPRGIEMEARLLRQRFGSGDDMRRLIPVVMGRRRSEEVVPPEFRSAHYNVEHDPERRSRIIQRAHEWLNPYEAVLWLLVERDENGLFSRRQAVVLRGFPKPTVVDGGRRIALSPAKAAASAVALRVSEVAEHAGISKDRIHVVLRCDPNEVACGLHRAATDSARLALGAHVASISVWPDDPDVKGADEPRSLDKYASCVIEGPPRSDGDFALRIGKSALVLAAKRAWSAAPGEPSAVVRNHEYRLATVLCEGDPSAAMKLRDRVLPRLDEPHVVLDRLMAARRASYDFHLIWTDRRMAPARGLYESLA